MLWSWMEDDNKGEDKLNDIWGNVGINYRECGLAIYLTRSLTSTKRYLVQKPFSGFKSLKT